MFNTGAENHNIATGGYTTVTLGDSPHEYLNINGKDKGQLQHCKANKLAEEEPHSHQIR
jgi:hypothetical protein